MGLLYIIIIIIINFMEHDLSATNELPCLLT